MAISLKLKFNEGLIKSDIFTAVKYARLEPNG